MHTTTLDSIRRRTASLALAVVLIGVPTLRAELPGSDAALLERGFVFVDLPTRECHASTLVETARGDLLAAWFAGTGEGDPDVRIWTSLRRNGAWSPPSPVADGSTGDERFPTWNPVLHRAGDGTLLLFYKVGPSPTEWWGMILRSLDDGATWSEPERLPDGILGPIRAKPLAVGNDLLCGSSTEHDGWRVHFESTADLGRTWTSTGPVHDGVEFGAIQPTFLVHGSRIQALSRSRQNRITQIWSQDGGRTWGEMTATSLPNPSAGIDAVTLPDGRHLLIYNHTSRLPGERPAGGTRSRLNLALSDDGEDWQAALLLENQPGEFSYPAMIQTRDGLVHVTYTWKRRRIRHAVIDPLHLESRPIVDGRWPEDSGSRDRP